MISDLIFPLLLCVIITSMIKIFKTIIIAISLLFCVTCFSFASSISGSGKAKLVVTDSGKVLYGKFANLLLYPASLTKVMTIYLAFESLRKQQFAANSELLISRKASAMRSSKIWLTPGDTISMKDAVLSLIVKSANDSAVVVAENISGSEKAFVKKMNIRAKQLGMKKTNFMNASGWHHPRQYTTAYDMAKLAIAIKRDFPEYYHLFSRVSFYYKGNFFRNHNYVIEDLYGAEGMKTGYTSKAGWNIITSTRRGGTTLIGVILGGQSYQARDKEMMRLMNLYFKKHVKS